MRCMERWGRPGSDGTRPSGDHWSHTTRKILERVGKEKGNESAPANETESATKNDLSRFHSIVTIHGGGTEKVKKKKELSSVGERDGAELRCDAK